jgi:hypothetical protein
MVVTLTNLPPSIEQALLARASAERRPVESVVLDVVARELGIPLPKAGDTTDLVDSINESSTNGSSELQQPDTSKTTYTQNEDGAILVRPATTDAAGNPLPKRRDLSDVVGQHLIDDEMRKVFEEQRQIDPELWK